VVLMVLATLMAFLPYLASFTPLGLVIDPDKDLYATLEISKTATQKDVTKAYKKLSLKHHPDKNPKSKYRECNTKFKELGHAYRILSDPTKRNQYDRRLRQMSESQRSRPGFQPNAREIMDESFIHDFKAPWLDDLEDEGCGFDAHEIFNEAFGMGFNFDRVRIKYINGRFQFVPREIYGPPGDTNTRPEPQRRRHRDITMDIEDGTRTLGSRDTFSTHEGGSEEYESDGAGFEEKMTQIARMFPGVETDLLKDVLGSHEGNMEKTCGALLEMKLGTMNNFNNENIINSTERLVSEGAAARADGTEDMNVWEKLQQLRDMFPAQDEDVLYEILLWNQGDMTKAVDACLNIQTS